MSNLKRKASNDGASAAKKAKPAVNSGFGMCLGQNSMGQCGLGMNISERKKPALCKNLPEGTLIQDIAAGGVHTAIVTQKGEVYTFGCNDEGALGRTCNATDELEKDEVEALPGRAEGLDGVTIVEVSAGDSHTFARAENGDVYGTGCFRDTNGALAFSDKSFMANAFVKVYPPDEAAPEGVYPKAIKIDSGCDHVVLLAEDAETGATKVFTYGTGEQGQLGRVSNKNSERGSNHRGVKVPDCSDEFREAVQKKRTTLAALTTLLKFHVVAETLFGSKRLTSVHACGWSTFAVDATGKVYSWGLNNYQQLAINKKAKKVITTSMYPLAAKMFKAPITQIAGGQHHIVALGKDGTVYTLGRGEMGQLGVMNEAGTGPKPETDTPVAVGGIDGKVIKVAAGSACTFAIMESGKAFAWGFGENLQLTNGIEEDAATPILCQGKQIDDRKILAIDAGGQHSVIVAMD